MPRSKHPYWALCLLACEGSSRLPPNELDAKTSEFVSEFDQICAVDDPPEDCSAQFGGPNDDASCTTDTVAIAEPCRRNCLLPCGFNGLGLTSCNCAGGQLFTCECLRPPSYAGARTAPSCDEVPDAGGSREIAALEGKPCDTAWDQCVGNDPNFPRHTCACVPAVDPQTRRFAVPEDLSWVCSDLTFRWFSLEPP